MLSKLFENTDIYTIKYAYSFLQEVTQLSVTKWLKDLFDSDVKCKTSILYTF